MAVDVQQVVERVFGDDRALFDRAMTRKAWVLERVGAGRSGEHHEALECLGDAWLGAVVLTELLRRFPQADQGALTQGRTTLVSDKSLARIAQDLGLEGSVRAGIGEVQQEQHLTEASMASHLEALVGAVYLKGGLAEVEWLVGHLYAGRWPGALSEVAAGVENAKGALGERVQAMQRTPGAEPRYETEVEPGRPPHQARFRATVSVPWGTFSGSWEPTKKAAEQDAARVALVHASDAD